MKIYITDLEKHIQEKVTSLFFIKKVSLISSTKHHFLSVVLADKSGEIEAKVWKEHIKSNYQTLEPGIYQVKVSVTQYQGVAVSIEDIKKVTQYDLSDFASCYHNIDAMYNELLDIIATIKKPHIKALCESFYTDSIMEGKLKMCQAGTVIHHVRIGGFVAHTLGMLKCAMAYIPIFRSIRSNDDYHKDITDIDEDIVKSTCLLHDIGKVREFVPLPGNERTADGIMRGHITMSSELTAVAIFNLKSNGIPFPSEDETKLTHCILASHDFCGPNMSACKEAVLVSRADSMDSMCNAMDTAIYTDNTSGQLTKYNKYLGTQVYKF